MFTSSTVGFGGNTCCEGEDGTELYKEKLADHNNLLIQQRQQQQKKRGSTTKMCFFICEANDALGRMLERMLGRMLGRMLEKTMLEKH